MTYILRTRQANRHFRLSRQYIYIIIIDLRQTGYRGDLACSLALYTDILAVLTSGPALSASLHPAQSLRRPPELPLLLLLLMMLMLMFSFSYRSILRSRADCRV